jgi:two-component system response regulator YesN
MKEYQLYFMEILSALMKLARLFDIESSEIIPEGTGMLVEFERFDSISQAKDWINDLSLNLRNAIADKRQDASQVLFEKAMDYINENFGDSELTVQKISGHLYISPSYMNLIFKKKSGKTFLKNLTSVRLEKAKELLADGSNRIAEVAGAVGYPDISYFSYFFKKKTGKSPREFKKFLEKANSG